VQFTFDGEFYKIARITSPTHNFLGISFGDSEDGRVYIEALGESRKKESIFAKDVKEQVLLGINEINSELKSDYKVKKIQFVSSDTPSNSVYMELAKEIVKGKIKRDFLHALKRGTGEAFLLMQKYLLLDFSEEIKQGVLENHAYDGQAESSRAEYLYELIELSNKKEEILKSILYALEHDREDTWDLLQFFELSKMFAKNGSVEAKKAIYQAFLSSPIEGSDWVGYSSILELDGFDGLLFICRAFGKHLHANPNDWQDAFIVEEFQDEHPDLEVWKELEVASKSDRWIKIYLDEIEETKREHEVKKQTKRVRRSFKDKTKITTYSRASILEEIKSSKEPEKFVEMLTEHYAEGDSKLLKELVVSCFDEDEIEKLAIAIIDLYSVLKSREMREPLEVLYNKMNCGIHRYALVKLLMEQNLLSDKIREEIVYDSFMETRRLLRFDTENVEKKRKSDEKNKRK